MTTLLPQSWPKPLLNGIRAYNRHVLNPLLGRPAGSKHWYAAAVRHTGRRSGKPYSTPVVAERFAGGFVIPLPYGTEVDWLRNVLAAGQAVVSFQGSDYDVVRPEIIDAAAAIPLLTSWRQRIFQRFGMDHYLKVLNRPVSE